MDSMDRPTERAAAHRDTSLVPPSCASSPGEQIACNIPSLPLDDDFEVANYGQTFNSSQMTEGVLPYETQVTQKGVSFLDHHETSPIALLWDLDSDKAFNFSEANFPLHDRSEFQTSSSILPAISLNTFPFSHPQHPLTIIVAQNPRKERVSDAQHPPNAHHRLLPRHDAPSRDLPTLRARSALL
jgi:hypothetical protein